MDKTQTKTKEDKSKSKDKKKGKESDVGETSAVVKSKLKEKNAIPEQEEPPETGKKSKKSGKGKLSIKKKVTDPGKVISTTGTEGKSSYEAETKPTPEVKDVVKVEEVKDVVKVEEVKDVKVEEVKDVVKVSDHAIQTLHTEHEARKSEPNHVHQQKQGETVKSQVEETLHSLEQFLAAPEISEPRRSREAEEEVLKAEGSDHADVMLENILDPINREDLDMDERAGSHSKKSSLAKETDLIDERAESHSKKSSLAKETDLIDFTENKDEMKETMLERKQEDLDITDIVESITGSAVNKENLPQTEREN